MLIRAFNPKCFSKIVGTQKLSSAGRSDGRRRISHSSAEPSPSTARAERGSTLGNESFRQKSPDTVLKRGDLLGGFHPPWQERASPCLKLIRRGGFDQRLLPPSACVVITQQSLDLLERDGASQPSPPPEAFVPRALLHVEQDMVIASIARRRSDARAAGSRPGLIATGLRT